MTDKAEALSTFVWCATFALTASTFQTLLEMFSTENPEPYGKRDYLRAVVQITAVGFWGGLAGWAMQAVMPNAPGELLGVAAAVLGSGGPKATQTVLKTILESVFKVKIVELAEPRREDPPST